MTLMETLYKEHDEIWAFTEQMTQKCIDLMEHNIFDADSFRADIAYIRTYADATHHKKEEDLLFRAMLDELGQVAENLIRHGMLVEHDQARLYVMELETRPTVLLHLSWKSSRRRWTMFICCAATLRRKTVQSIPLLSVHCLPTPCASWKHSFNLNGITHNKTGRHKRVCLLFLH